MVNLKQYYVHKKSTYKFELTADEYNPTIDDEVEISVRVTDYADDPVSGLSVELFDNGTSVSASITNNSGIASWTVTLSDWDNHRFTVNGASLDLNAEGYKNIWSNSTSNPTIVLSRNKNNARLYINAYNGNFTTTWVRYGNSAFMSSVAPSQSVVRLNNDATVLISIGAEGYLQWKSNTGATLSNKTIYAQIDWSIA